MHEPSRVLWPNPSLDRILAGGLAPARSPVSLLR